MDQKQNPAGGAGRRGLLAAASVLGIVIKSKFAAAAAPGSPSVGSGTGPFVQEETLEPDLPIIDTHHHLFDMMSPKPGGRGLRYLFPEILADMHTGHRFLGSVIVGGAGFARASGPEALRVVGDTEFTNGASAQAASGKYGPELIGAGIVGQADLTMGSAVRPVLEAHLRAGGDRFRGIRHMTVWSDDPKLHPPGKMAAPDEAFHPDFRRGYAELEPLGLSFDAWCYFTQLDGIAGLARDFPNTTIIMNHCGGPLGSSTWAAKKQEALVAWRTAVRGLSQYPNVYMKLGGLGMAETGLPSVGSNPPSSSLEIATEQRPYLETCIEAFGADRCTFESNYPVEAGVGTYHTVWNAFKRVTANYSAAEKAALYSGTASKAYRLTLI